MTARSLSDHQPTVEHRAAADRNGSARLWPLTTNWRFVKARDLGVQSRCAAFRDGNGSAKTRSTSGYDSRHLVITDQSAEMSETVRRADPRHSSRTFRRNCPRYMKSPAALSGSHLNPLNTALCGMRNLTIAAASVVASILEWPTDPAQDWLSARDVLGNTSGLSDMFAEARVMRLFRARDEVGGTLAALWLATGGYTGAERPVQLALDR